ncbi:MAG TPA: hypothetical protein VIT88_14300 [Pyrinomonadaceae bacterium]
MADLCAILHAKRQCITISNASTDGMAVTGEVFFRTPIRCPRCDRVVPSWKLVGLFGAVTFSFLGLLKFLQIF